MFAQLKSFIENFNQLVDVNVPVNLVPLTLLQEEKKICANPLPITFLACSIWPINNNASGITKMAGMPH